MALIPICLGVAHVAAGAWSRAVRSIETRAYSLGGLRLALVTTASPHGLFDGARVPLSGAAPPELNGSWTAQVVSPESFALDGTNGITGQVNRMPALALAPADLSSIEVRKVYGGFVIGPTLVLRCESLAAGQVAHVALEDSLDGFGSAVPRMVRGFAGPIIEGGPAEAKSPIRELPGNRYGVQGAEMRLNVLELWSGAAPKLSAWIEAA